MLWFSYQILLFVLMTKDILKNYGHLSFLQWKSIMTNPTNAIKDYSLASKWPPSASKRALAFPKVQAISFWAPWLTDPSHTKGYSTLQNLLFWRLGLDLREKKNSSVKIPFCTSMFEFKIHSLKFTLCRMWSVRTCDRSSTYTPVSLVERISGQLLNAACKFSTKIFLVRFFFALCPQ